MDKYQIVSEYGDQLSMNLFFYGKWKKLPVVYNFQLKDEINRYHIQTTSVKAIVLHFIVKEPWLTKNYFYKEWKSNLDRAESIDLSDIPEGKKWSKKQLRRYSNYLDIREWVIWYLSLPFRLVIRIMVVLMGYVLIVFKILPKEHLSYLWEASVHMNFKEIKISLINKIFEREARVQVHDGE